MDVPIRGLEPLTALTVLAATALAVAPARAADAPDLRTYYAQRIVWHPCSASRDPLVQAETKDGEAKDRAECASLTVPYTYARPGRGDITLALMRFRAQGPEKRLGSLLINFGGPGGSGLKGLSEFGPDAFGKARSRYDLVTFDPRGIGASAPVQCGTQDEVANVRYGRDSTPANTTEMGKFLHEQTQAYSTCVAKSKGVLPWVGTVNVARDLDVMRHALGDDKLNYLGISYGTKIGAVYAHQFPRKVGRMALDGVAPPVSELKATSIAQAAGYQRALEHVVEECVAQGASCPLGVHKEQAMSDIVDGLNRLETHPLKLPDGTEMDQDTAIDDIMALLRSRDSLDQTPALLAAVVHGVDPGEADDEARQEVAQDEGREDDGTYDNSSEAMPAVKCLDTAGRYSEKEVDAAYDMFVQASPVFGSAMAPAMAMCSGWPEPGDDTSQNVSAQGAAKVLMATAEFDPATPHAWMAKMARAMGSAVTIDDMGGGHGLYPSKGATCVRAHFDAFLLDGTLPKDGTQCP